MAEISVSLFKYYSSQNRPISISGFHQHLPDQIYFEPAGLAPESVAQLQAMGHTLVERTGMSGDAQVIIVDGALLKAWSDPRRGGQAIGY